MPVDIPATKVRLQEQPDGSIAVVYGKDGGREIEVPYATMLRWVRLRSEWESAQEDMRIAFDEGRDATQFHVSRYTFVAQAPVVLGVASDFDVTVYADMPVDRARLTCDVPAVEMARITSISLLSGGQWAHFDLGAGIDAFEFSRDEEGRSRRSTPPVPALPGVLGLRVKGRWLGKEIEGQAAGTPYVFAAALSGAVTPVDYSGGNLPTGRGRFGFGFGGPSEGAPVYSEGFAKAIAEAGAAPLSEDPLEGAVEIVPREGEGEDAVLARALGEMAAAEALKKQALK